MVNLAEYISENDPNFRKSRLPALYSDFRSQKTLNPDGYRANIAAWQGALSSLALKGVLSNEKSKSSALILDIDESLPHSLGSRRFGQPLALGTVIREAISDGSLISYSDFLQPRSTNVSHHLSSLTWNAAGWAFRQLGIARKSSIEDSLPAGRYVIMNNIEAACQEFMQQTANKTSHFDRTFTKSQFRTIFGGKLIPGNRLTEEDVEALLTHLARDKHLIVYNGEIIRLRVPSDAPEIGEEDAAMASIKELIANLKHQTEILNRRIDDLQKAIASALERKNRVSALAALKSKKLAETSLTRRYATLNQLEDVAAKLEQASDQVQIIKVMKSSTSVLKSLNSQVGRREQVEEIMDKVREQMSETDEVAAILAESIGDPLDESEIDLELEALEMETQKESELEKDMQSQKEVAAKLQEMDSKLVDLPDPLVNAVPDRGLSTSPTTETKIATLSLGHI